MNLLKKIVPSVGLVLALGLLLIVGCSRNSQSIGVGSSNGSSSVAKVEPRGKAFFSFFDTVSYVYSYAGDDDERFNECTDGVAAILDEYHKLFDIYYEYSGINNLCTVNKMAGGDPVEVDPKLVEFLLYCKDICELTDGMVDVMMGSVLSIWHDARTSDEKYLPTQDVLDEAALHVGFEFLEMDKPTVQ